MINLLSIRRESLFLRRVEINRNHEIGNENQEEGVKLSHAEQLVAFGSNERHHR